MSSFCYSDQIYFTPNNSLVTNLMQKINDQYFKSLGLEYNCKSLKVIIPHKLYEIEEWRKVLKWYGSFLVTGFASEEDLVKSYIKTANDEIIRSSADFDSTAPVLAGIVFSDIESNETFPSQIQVFKFSKLLPALSSTIGPN